MLAYVALTFADFAFLTFRARLSLSISLLWDVLSCWVLLGCLPLLLLLRGLPGLRWLLPALLREFWTFRGGPLLAPEVPPPEIFGDGFFSSSLLTRRARGSARPLRPWKSVRGSDTRSCP
jgi:hypothetical protein